MGVWEYGSTGKTNQKWWNIPGVRSRYFPGKYHPRRSSRPSGRYLGIVQLDPGTPMRRTPKKSKAAQGTPVFTSGVGGVALEDQTAAYVLAAMLADQPPFGEEIGRIARIDWQADESGWRFDDLVLTCTGAASPRVSISCKSGKYVTSKGWKADATNRLWQQWNTSTDNPFRRDIDLMAVVTATLANGVGDAWNAIVQQALNADPKRLALRIEGPGRANAIGRALFTSLKCPAAIAKAGSDELEERVALLRRTRLWHRDLLTPAQVPLAGVRLGEEPQ